MLLLALVPYLREHGPTPVAELARAFDAGEDAVRRLVAFLGTAGVPGETHTYQPEDLFDIDWDALEQHDIVSLTHIVAVDDTPRFSPAEHAALVAGLHALREMLPPSEREEVDRTAAKLALAGAASPAPAISVTPDPADPVLPVLLDAMERGRRISFDYRNLRGEAARRTVEPLELSQLGGGWYLRAFCLERGAERTFLVDAMRGPEVQEQKAERRAVRGRVRRSIGPEASEIVAVLHLSEAALHRIAAFSPRIIAPTTPPDPTTTDGRARERWIAAEVRLGHPATAIRLVQAAPGDLVVVEPAEAREAVLAWAERALAPYGD